jgi:hypothetical protein
VPGPRLALDANTLLAYYCDEASGTTLANSVTGNAYPLALVGNYLLGNLGLFSHGTSATRFPAPANGASTFPGTADRAYNNAVSVALAGPCTLEAVFTADTVPGQFGGIIAEISDSSRSNGLYLAANGYNFLQAGMVVSGSYYAASVTTNLYVPRIHVAAVFDGANIVAYVNGVQASSSSAPSAPGTLTKMAIGNSTAGQQPLRGLVAEVRVSNVARNATYCAAAFAAANGL